VKTKTKQNKKTNKDHIPTSAPRFLCCVLFAFPTKRKELRISKEETKKETKTENLFKQFSFNKKTHEQKSFWLRNTFPFPLRAIVGTSNHGK